jgi:hypothetical protein
MKTSALKNHGNSTVTRNQGAWFSSELQLMLFILALIVIFLVIYQIYYKTPYTATALYFDYASKVIHGSIPYRDFNFEYPPAALFFFILPRLVASSYPVFAVVYQVEVLVFVLIGLFVFYRIALRLGKAPWKLLAVYTLCVLAIGPISAQQYDIFPAILTLLALYYFWTGQHTLSWGLLALGTLTKIFPVVIAPIFLIYYLRNREYRLAWSGILTFVFICLIVAIPFVTIGQDTIRSLFNYHTQRGLQIESVYSSFLLIASKLGLSGVKLVFNFGSWNLSGPLADTLAKLSTYFLGLFLLVAYWFIYRQMRPGKSQFSRIGAYSLLAVSIVLITSKVLSPQYLIWLIPFIPLIFNRGKFEIIFTFVLIGALTYYIFPLRYLVLLKLDTGLIVILLARNILVIVLAVLAGVFLSRMKASE